jgi:hypothetical protein
MFPLANGFAAGTRRIVAIHAVGANLGKLLGDGLEAVAGIVRFVWLRAWGLQGRIRVRVSPGEDVTLPRS